MSEIKGDLDVCDSVNVGARVNQAYSRKSISATQNLNSNSAFFQILTASANQDVILPDATSLPDDKAVQFRIRAIGATLTVKTYHATLPVLLKSIVDGRTYEFTLIDDSSVAGVWEVNYIEESDFVASSRYTTTFNATTDWGTASGGYYSQTVTAAVHGRGTSPSVILEEKSGTDYIQVIADQVKIATTGNVTFRVPNAPDCRFEGRALFV